MNVVILVKIIDKILRCLHNLTLNLFKLNINVFSAKQEKFGYCAAADKTSQDIFSLSQDISSLCSLQENSLSAQFKIISYVINLIRSLGFVTVLNLLLY